MVKEYTEVVQEVVNDTKLRDKTSKASKNGEIVSHATNKRKL